jgi:hypothetical protein
MFDTNVRTTVVLRGARLRLKRGWLSGLWAWDVHADKHLGWVLQQSEGRKWACVPVPETSEEQYDQIWYEYDTREQALRGLLP